MQQQEQHSRMSRPVRYKREDGTRTRKARGRAQMLRRQRQLKSAEAR